MRFTLQIFHTPSHYSSLPGSRCTKQVCHHVVNYPLTTPPVLRVHNEKHRCVRLENRDRFPEENHLFWIGSLTALHLEPVGRKRGGNAGCSPSRGDRGNTAHIHKHMNTRTHRHKYTHSQFFLGVREEIHSLPKTSKWRTDACLCTYAVECAISSGTLHSLSAPQVS